MIDDILYDQEAYDYETYVLEQRFLKPAKEIASLISKLGTNEEYYLDLGTGTGVVLFQILEYFGVETKVFGLDSSSEMLKVARKKGGQFLVKANLPEIPFIEEYFDFLIASFVLSHIADSNKFVSEINRVLKSGGYFIFTTWGEGQKNYNKLWSSVVKKYLSEQELNKVISSYIPNEELFEDRNKVLELFNKNNFELVNSYEKRYDLDLKMKDYLQCRFSLLISQYMRKVFHPSIWNQFKKEMTTLFETNVGENIVYSGNVNFFVFQKK